MSEGSRNFVGRIVLNGSMRRSFGFGITLVALVAGVFPAAAGARLVELGKTSSDPMPSCPGNPCLAISRTSAYQAKVGPDRQQYVVPENGRIVAWSITLSTPNSK